MKKERMSQAECEEELTICKKPRLAYNNCNQIDFNLDSKNINLLSSNSKIIGKYEKKLLKKFFPHFFFFSSQPFYAQITQFN